MYSNIGLTSMSSTTESFLKIGTRVPDADEELLEYIKDFVHDKNGRCLKAEIIQSISYNWVGIGVNQIIPDIYPERQAPYGGTWSRLIFFKFAQINIIAKLMDKLHKKLEEFEKSGIYNGTGLSIETSKRSGRIIYRYIDMYHLGNLLCI